MDLDPPEPSYRSHVVLPRFGYAETRSEWNAKEQAVKLKTVENRANLLRCFSMAGQAGLDSMAEEYWPSEAVGSIVLTPTVPGPVALCSSLQEPETQRRISASHDPDSVQRQLSITYEQLTITYEN